MTVGKRRQRQAIPLTGAVFVANDKTTGAVPDGTTNFLLGKMSL